MMTHMAGGVWKAPTGSFEGVVTSICGSSSRLRVLRAAGPDWRESLGWALSPRISGATARSSAIDGLHATLRVSSKDGRSEPLSWLQMLLLTVNSSGQLPAVAIAGTKVPQPEEIVLQCAAVAIFQTIVIDHLLQRPDGVVEFVAVVTAIGPFTPVSYTHLTLPTILRV